MIAACAVTSGLGCAGLLGLDDFTDGGSGGAPGATSATGSTGDTTATGTSTSTGDAASTGTSGDGGGSTSDTSSSAGGGTGTGGETGSGGSGGDGQGGAGGGGVLGCTADESFEIFSTEDLDGVALDTERLFVTSRPNSNRVHVAVNAEDGFRIYARTVRTGAVPDLGSVSVYPTTPGNGGYRVVGAYAKEGSVHLWGEEQGKVGEFVFPADEDIGQEATFREYPHPSACYSYHGLGVQLGLDGVTRFAAVCVTSPVAAQSAILYGGTPDAVEFTLPAVAALDGEPPPDRKVRSYGYVSGTHVIFTGTDDFSPDDVAFVRMGVNAAGLGTSHQVSPPEGHAIFFVPGPEFADGMFLGALHADPLSLQTPPLDGAYRAGSIDGDDAFEVAEDPVATLPHAIVFDDISEVAPAFQVHRAGQLVVGAAVSNFSITEPDAARMNLWTAEGEVLVAGFPAAESPDGVSFLAASAAPSGFGNIGVAWSQIDADDVYTVRGVAVQCLQR
jgi:hypothetical protein